MIFLRFAKMLLPLLLKWLPSKFAPQLSGPPQAQQSDSSWLPSSQLLESLNMLSIKNTVDLHGIQPETIIAVIVSNDVYARLGHECVVTSCLDSQHRSGTLHKHGFAVDLRTKHIPTEKQSALASEIATRLGPQFDVILESDHLHIEFDNR